LINKRKIELAVLIIIISPGLWFFEGYENSIARIKHIQKGHESFVFSKERKMEKALNDHGFSKDDFQATLLLPLVNKGSEKFGGETNSDWFLSFNYLARLEMGIPSLAYVLQRASIGESCNLSQFLSDPSIKKERLEDMDSRDILLIVDDERKTRFDEVIISKSDSICRFSNIDLYRAPISAFDHIEYDNSKDTVALNYCGEFSSSDCSSFLFYEQYGTVGKPGYPQSVHLKESTEPFTIDVRKFAGKKMEFSAWYNITRHVAEGMYPKIELLDVDGKIIWKRQLYNLDSQDFISNWRRVSFDVDLGAPDIHSLRHSFVIKDHPVRNILLRVKDADVTYQLSDELLWKNNYFFHLKD
jgi:hypothetical protein